MIYVNVLGQIPRAPKCSHSGWNKYVTSSLFIFVLYSTELKQSMQSYRIVRSC